VFHKVPLTLLSYHGWRSRCYSCLHSDYSYDNCFLWYWWIDCSVWIGNSDRRCKPRIHNHSQLRLQNCRRACRRESVGAVTSYTFTNVVTDRTITASFVVSVPNADPVISYVHVWGSAGLVDPGGLVSVGDSLLLYSRVTDVETSSDQLL